VHDLHVKDYLTFENSLLGNIGRPSPAVVSFEVVWNAVGEVNVFDNAAQQFRGEFRNASAHAVTELPSLTSRDLAEHL
jgi:hypothetical protein